MPKIGTKTYDQYTVNANSVQYKGPAHTVSRSDLLQLGRTLPTASGSADRGVQKSVTKLTRTCTINTETGATRNGIVNFETSFPVGISEADALSLIADAATAAASSCDRQRDG